MNVLATGSWDKTVKYWDCRASRSVGTLQLPGRANCMDAVHPLMLVGCGTQACVVDLKSPTRIFSRPRTPLKFQLRACGVFPDHRGFAIGSIEGRCAIMHLSERDRQYDFAFKCHRYPKGNDVNPVNAISFHPRYGTFATAGADGVFNFWDKDSKQRLKAFKNCPASIVDLKFNKDGNLICYATGYDWARGISGYSRNIPNNLFIHVVKDDLRSRGRPRN
jgi:mRNA export factor